MVLNPGCYLIEDNHFALYEVSKYKLAFQLMGLSCAKLQYLQVLQLVDDRHYHTSNAYDFIQEVHNLNSYQIEEIKNNG